MAVLEEKLLILEFGEEEEEAAAQRARAGLDVCGHSQVQRKQGRRGLPSRS